MTNEIDLISKFESLPVYESFRQNVDQTDVFDLDQELPSGVINLIRRKSILEQDDDNMGPEDDSINEVEKIENNRENDDDDDTSFLKSRVKHFFILSENGKPVFTRHGDEEQLITLMGVMQTLVSFAELTESNQLKYLKAGPCRIAFLHREPLIFVVVTHDNEDLMSLHHQLVFLYYQIISTLTLSRIKQKFHQQPNFDLRRWLSTAEKKLLHNIIDMYEHDLGMLFTSAKCLTIPLNIRSQIGQVVVQTIRGQRDMVFAIILTHGQLVTIARLRNYSLHPSDLYLLVNLVESSDAFKGVESWVPVCLPRFDPGGCLHAHISYLDDSCDVCLVLLTVNAEHFQILSNFKQAILEKLKKQNLINHIKTALGKTNSLSNDSFCNELRYFAYNSRGICQYISSKLSKPYTIDEQHKRLFNLIRSIYGRLHKPNHHIKTIFYRTEYESLFGWLTPGFELHIVLAPLVKLETITLCVDRILSYIRKEENQLFIMKCEYF